MSRSIKVLTALMVLLSACGPADPRPTPATARTGASVVRSGFSLRDGRIGVAALVRVRGSRTIRDITLGISFFADDRRVGAQQSDVLPYCPPSTECWWGQSFVGEQLGDTWQSIDRVALDVTSTGAHTRPGAIVDRLRVAVENDEVLVTPEAKEGTAYLLAAHGSTPSYGMSFFTRKDESDSLRYPKVSFPRDDRDRVFAVFYPGPVPASAYGPGD